MSDIKENQWYHSPESKRLFMVKEIHFKGAGPTTRKSMVVLVEALKENEIFHEYADFEKLIKNDQLQKIS